MSRSTICPRSTTASPRSASRRPTPASSATSSPAPASTIARSRPRARSRSRSAFPQRFGDGARARDIGPLKIKISGCINACGHHHVGHIGILGLERAGEETYQITLGGSGDETASIGQITGPGFSSEKVVDAIETVVETYMSQRSRAGGGVPRRPSAASAWRRSRRRCTSAAPDRTSDERPRRQAVRRRDRRLAAGDRFRAREGDLAAAARDRGPFPGRIALVSSFGADSAVLLHMVAGIDKATPVVFVDTGQHFPETLAYRDRLVEQLGLTNYRLPSPRRRRCARGRPGEIPVRERSRPLLRNPQGAAARRGAARATTPGSPAARASRPSTARARRCSRPKASASRSIRWSAGARRDILAYIKQADLPPHPLVAKGFPSIGCLPCTSPVRPGEDARAGRWRGEAKTECGIHLGALDAGGDI